MNDKRKHGCFFILLFCRRVATKAYLLTKQHIERRFKDVLLVQSPQKMSDSIAYHLCWDVDVECRFQQYVSYSMAVNSLGWGNQQRIEKSLTNFAAFKVVTCTLLHGRKSDGSGYRHCNIMDQICLDQMCALHSLCK